MNGAVIKVIGLGGAGNNAINRMIEQGLSGVEFIAANTDAQVLAKSLADVRIQLGDRLTRGLGAGANPEIGEKAALESQDLIAEHLEGADLVFITAGMGGGTGTGAAPVVAEVANRLGALTVAVVTRPFRIEGPRRLRVAEEGIERLRDRVDALIVVDNERLLKAVDRKVSLKEAFLIADRVLYHGVRGISDIINTPGMINVDFADVRNMLQGAGQVLLSIGAGSGDDRVEKVAKSAIHSPLLDRSIEGAQRLLINLVSEEDITLDEAMGVVEQIRQATGVEDPDVLLGVTYDNKLGGEIRAVVIASDFTSAQSEGFAARSPSVDPGDYEIPAFLRYGDS